MSPTLARRTSSAPAARPSPRLTDLQRRADAVGAAADALHEQFGGPSEHRRRSGVAQLQPFERFEPGSVLHEQRAVRQRQRLVETEDRPVAERCRAAGRRSR